MASTRQKLLVPVAASLVGLVVVAALWWRDRGVAPPLVDPPVLTVAAEHVRYRFATDRGSEARELEATIPMLEARYRETRSPLDAAELADAHFRRAQRGGERRADYATAERHANDSLAILRTPNGALLTLAKLAAARHQFRAAIELATEYLGARPSAGAHVVIATARLALGELPAALVAAERAVALQPSTNAHTTRALVLQAMGRDAEAAAAFAKAVALEQGGDPDGAARLRALWARFLVRRGAYRSAAHLLDEAARIAPAEPLAIAQRGELALRTGKAAEAARLFERAFEHSREVRYLIDEARAREAAGQREHAAALRVQLESLVRGELAEDALGHTVDLVEVLADRGTPEALAEAIARGREELARRASFEVRYQLARALYRAARLDAAPLGGRDALVDEARAQVQAALALGTREAALFELASRIEGARGNVAGATMYTRLANEVDPARSGWRTVGLGGGR